jgi:glucuronoarabinoxylan endo-1,4-beta-xylanase
MRRTGTLAAGILAAAALATTGFAQTITNVIDGFDPSGVKGNLYSAGQITNVWMNWFGSAFQSLSWDSSSDAGSNAGSGSLKINANFNSASNQFVVYDGLTGITPPVNGAVYTNFQCDIRFAPGSATQTNGGIAYFGEVQFGIAVGFSQDFFGGIAVPASNTNWVHVSMQLDPNMDPNLTNIADILIHIYGPYLGAAGLNGPSTLWVDNIKFTGPAPTPTNCVVNWTDVHQNIDGFGASSAWNGSLTQAQMNMFYSTNTGIGLSLLRSRIAPDGTTVEGAAMQMAQSNGARVWSTPWTPPAAYKDSGSVNGGHFISSTSNYQGFANQTANYVRFVKTNYGVNLYAVSMQNEPDQNTTYESCVWTSQQLHDYMPFLHAALSNDNVASTKILMPEFSAWNFAIASNSLADTVTSNMIGILAGHDYDYTVSPVNSGTKALWETEVSTFDNFDGSIANAIYWAENIHSFLTVAQVNAWHFWWLIPIDGLNHNEGLTDEFGNPAKRMYVLGNYSRFVRPGFARIGVANNALPTYVSAYKDTNTGKFAIVAVNSINYSYAQTFNFSGFGTPVVTPWVTSGSLSLSNQAPIAVSNSTFVYNLPAWSVVTFVGQTGTVVPTLAVHVAGTQSTLTIGGPAGGGYTIWGSTDLSHWQSLLTTNPLVTPAVWVDPGPAVATKYYRVSLAQ